MKPIKPIASPMTMLLTKPSSECSILGPQLLKEPRAALPIRVKCKAFVLPAGTCQVVLNGINWSSISGKMGTTMMGHSVGEISLSPSHWQAIIIGQFLTRLEVLAILIILLIVTNPDSQPSRPVPVLIVADSVGLVFMLIG